MMIKKIILLILFFAAAVQSFSQERLLVKGMKITRSVKIKKQTYRFDAPVEMDRAVIIVEGNNITVDFNNAIISGSNSKKNPDEFFGVAVYIRSGKNIIIKNLKAKGYKIALIARNVSNLVIENCDLSYNYRQHLNSTQEKEDISDWLSHHKNENDEWLRYGSAMYLRGCEYFTIKNSRVTGGQNALMLTESNHGKIYNNDFSFNSGLGIGMYRSSFNTIAYNKINFNVRGYSHGIYNRGQDSAGILIYEQSNSNYFYKNSVTHSGDGFFLWAGQTTMDSGEGGCNDNVLNGNDFSYAPTNGVEMTFSRNVVMGNRIYECDHGLWGGYSFNSVIAGNQFRSNRIAIAIEHGQENEIHHNIFLQNKEAIRLWGRNEQPADWGYAKNRDTKSRDYIISNNNFTSNGIALNLNRTENIIFFDNIDNDNVKLLKIDSTAKNIDTTWNDEISERFSRDSAEFIPDIADPQNVFKGNNLLAGRKNIMMTEWGPYDFRSPIIWNSNPLDTSGIMKFNVLGPKGKWKIKNYRGVKNISKTQGEFPDSLTAEIIPGQRTDMYIELEYSGESITTTLGKIIPAKTPYKFFFKKFFQPIDFDVLWYAYDFNTHDPIKTGQVIPPNIRLRPVKTETTTKLDYAWWGGIKNEDQNYPQFVTIANGTAEFEKGSYEIGITWDDAVRVYMDGKLLIDEWNPSKYIFDESPNKKVKLSIEGKHSFTIEHVELNGFATLSLKIKKL